MGVLAGGAWADAPRGSHPVAAAARTRSTARVDITACLRVGMVSPFVGVARRDWADQTPPSRRPASTGGAHVPGQASALPLRDADRVHGGQIAGQPAPAVARVVTDEHLVAGGDVHRVGVVNG